MALQCAAEPLEEEGGATERFRRSGSRERRGRGWRAGGYSQLNLAANVEVREGLVSKEQWRSYQMSHVSSPDAVQEGSVEWSSLSEFGHD
jgi:hypothetical protein